MKTFIAALIVFALLLILIAVNACYIQEAAGDLQNALAALSSLPEEPAALEALDELWQRHRSFFSLSVAYEEIKEIDRQLLILHAAVQAGEEGDFHSARLQAQEALSHIRLLERFSLENLV